MGPGAVDCFLRTEIDSLPAELDEILRRVMQLEIEREALKKETDAASKELLEKLENPPPCGTVMPPSGSLHKQDLQCVADWVTSLGGSSGVDADAP